MRIINIVLIICIAFSSKLYSQSEYFYYYKDSKQYFSINTNKAYLQLSENINSEDLSNLLGIDAEVSEVKNDRTPITYSLEDNQTLPKENYWATIVFNKNLQKSEYLRELERIKDLSIVETVMPYFFNSKGSEVGLSQYLYVKIRNSEDFGLLQETCENYNLEIIGKNTYINNWYIVSANSNMEGNGLEMSALLYELNIFDVVEPDLMSVDQSYCENDPLFNRQWGLDAQGTITYTHPGTGIDGVPLATGTFTPTVDINACQAWDITKGDPSVMVAVFDRGLQIHEDLNFSSPTISYDSDNDVSPSDYYGTHGMNCAGIIGGIHNSDGIAGIAPNSNLMSISTDLGQSTPATRMNRARGFDFATENNVSIITNSWGYDDPSAVIDASIINAIENGRNGLGMIVVFASGNDDDGTVNYPASADANILAVGAMSPCAERKNPNSCDGEGWWGSNFGENLDIVAPGVAIPTTTEDNGFINNFNGTSSAAPHVAGVAALILSINPCLTGEQVRNIIEHTAQKVGGYGYSNNPNRLNGTWHEEVGYGLLDAFQSLIHTNTLFLQNQTDTGNEGHENIGSIRTGENVSPAVGAFTGDYIVDNSATVILKATETITLEEGTRIEAGSNFRAYIDEFNGECGEWLLPRTAPVDIPILDGSEVSVKSNIRETLAQEIQVEVFPNPFKDNFNLNIQLVKTDKFSLNVYNTTGQLIYSENGELDTGKHQLNIPIDNSNGLYIIRLKIGNEIIIKKLIKYE